MNCSKNKKVAVIGVPIDFGSKPLGVEMGPTAIRYAGLIDALKHNHFEFLDFGDLKVDRSVSQNKSIVETARISNKLANLVSDTISDGYIPIILGGDHSASIGSIAGASQQCKKLGLIWLDYHPDANTPESSPSGNIHGMTVAISLGYGYPELVQCIDPNPKILPENICIIGAKDIDQSEEDFLQQLDVQMFTLFDIERMGIVQVLENTLDTLSENCDAIHVSLDVDVLDPLIAPGTGILSKGGLSYREILYIMQTLGKLNLVKSIDIIEVNPLLDVKNQTAELAIELLITALGGSYGDYQRNYLPKLS